MSTETSHIFISYSRRDKEAMQRIVAHLRGQGIKMWVDNEGLVPGTPIWEEEIEKAIKGAFAIVVVLSPDAKKSEWVRREITLAEQFQKRPFPVLVNGDADDSIPLRLITNQYVNLKKNEPAGLEALSTAVQRYLNDLIRIEEIKKGEEEAERQRLAAQKAEEERIAKTKLEVERLAEEAEKEQQAKVEAKRLAAEKAAAERLADKKAEEERQAKARLEADRTAKEKAKIDQLEKERQEADNLIKNLLASDDKTNTTETNPARKATITPNRYTPLRQKSLSFLPSSPDAPAPSRSDLINRYRSLRREQYELSFHPLTSPTWWIISSIKILLSIAGMFLANFVTITYVFSRYNQNLPNLSTQTFLTTGAIWGFLYVIIGTSYPRSLFESTVKFLEVGPSYIYSLNESFFAILFGVFYRFQITFIISIGIAGALALFATLYLPLDLLTTFFWAFVGMSAFQMWAFMSDLDL